MIFGVSTEKAFAEGNALPVAGIEESDATLLSHFCATERWTASLDNAMLHLGPRACIFHGLDPAIGRFGLLEFVRCYDPSASRQIVSLFEKAAARACSFHYSAEVGRETGGKRLVHCFAEFEGGETGGRLNGLFLLPMPGLVQSGTFARI